MGRNMARIELDGGDSCSVITYPPRPDVWLVFKVTDAEEPAAYPITAIEARQIATALIAAAEEVEAKEADPPDDLHEAAAESREKRHG
jgi:hypothetical protein